MLAGLRLGGAARRAEGRSQRRRARGQRERPRSAGGPTSTVATGAKSAESQVAWGGFAVAMRVSKVRSEGVEAKLGRSGAEKTPVRRSLKIDFNTERPRLLQSS